MNNFILVYVTNPSREKAKEIAKYLLKKRLIACANIFPIESLYHWKGKLVEEKEHILILKTLDRYFGRIKREIEKIHPYSIPCIIKIPVSSNSKYFNWLKKEVRT